jgi:NADH:ubiquinone oxidoreductase subunit 6 (subunit J)
MPWELIFFYVIGAASVLCALGMVLAKNPVHSGIFLVLTFLNVAGIFVMLGAEFLAVIQIIVYTGAILILMLFVLMLVDPDDLPSFSSAAPLQRNLSVLLGIVLVLELAAAIITRTSLGAVGPSSSPCRSGWVRRSSAAATPSAWPTRAAPTACCRKARRARPRSRSIRSARPRSSRPAAR